jgi:hypothetical protein
MFLSGNDREFMEQLNNYCLLREYPMLQKAYHQAVKVQQGIVILWILGPPV